jgi:hypothetical protein
MSKLLFKETQRFNQKWIIILVSIPLVITLWGIVQQVILGEPFGNNPAPDWGLWLSLLVPVLIVGFIFSLTLHTRIDRNGIYYRFAPVHRNERWIKWSEVKDAYVRKYRPIKEYGGWGFRSGGRSGKALNTSGNMGLQIVFKDGKRLLLGTNKPRELERVLGKMDLHMEKIEGRG